MVLCKADRCTKHASFGYEAARYCLTHKTPEMRAHGKKSCDFEECIIRPSYGFEGRGAVRCQKHKELGMIPLISKKCTECNAQPSFGFKNEKPVKCGNHKEDGMVYLKFPQCKECDINARYGKVKNRPTHCSKHKSEEMWNVTDRTCKECTKRPTYGYTRAEYCQEHVKNDMKVFARNFCEEDGCSKTACFNIPGSKKAMYCTGHGRDGMINLWEKRCSVCLTTRVREGYEGHCAQCFSHAFPHSPKIRMFKTKERAVKDSLVKRWPDFIITHDKAVDCFKFRPDFVIELGSHTIVVEVDEFQHERYETSCDNKRLMSIFQGLGSRPMIMIRFNPDKYINTDGRPVKGCWHGSGLVRKGSEWDHRLDVLHGIIQKWVETTPEKEITYEYLFYNTGPTLTGPGAITGATGALGHDL